MKDLEILLKNEPGALAKMGATLGSYGVSLEGGGVFGNGVHSIAHFLVEDAIKAKEALELNNIPVEKINNVVIVKLRQDVPGQLGAFCQRIAAANVNILVQYSDHSNQLIMVVDKFAVASEIARAWMEEWW